MNRLNRKLEVYFAMAKKSLLVAFLLLVCLMVESTAKTLAEYKENISHIKSDFASLISKESVSDKQIKETEAAVYQEVSKMFPAEETIKFEGQTYEVKNQWLRNKVSEYRTTVDDPAKQKLIATEIYERLGAIELEINELEESVAAEITKDENKQKLSEVLKREEYVKPTEKQESFLMQIWRKIRDWFRSLFPEAEVPKAKPASNLGSVFYFLQIFIYILVFVVIAFVVYKFAPLFIKKLRAAKRDKKSERIILGETISADETSQNLFSEAEDLARNGNLRGAIRKGYIALLFELSERKAIGLAKHKTNRDYLRDVRKKRELFEKMNGLTLNYERHWYGFESADSDDWEEFRKGYKAALGSES